MGSVNNRIGIISHIDQTERKVDLPENERKADMFKKLFRWSKIEHDGYLWEEFKFFKRIMDIEDTVFNIWELPILSGLHVESAIKRMGDNVTTMRINSIFDDTIESEYQRLKEFDPDCIFLSTTFLLNKEQLSMAVGDVRSRFPQTPIVLGGNFIVKEIAHGYDVEQLLKVCGENVYIINSKYGEEEIINFLGAMRKEDEVFKLDADSNILRSQEREKKYSIDEWRVDYSRLNYGKTLAPIRTAAGCPFSCNFCSYPSSAGAYLTEDVVSTIKQLKALDTRGVRKIIFTDDTLNVPLQRFTRLLQSMVEEGLTNFQCFSFCRCQYLTEETVKLMKQCGFTAVLLGIESGSDTVLEHMNKRATTEQYLRGIELLKKNGIMTFSAIIIGHPGETDETIKETVEFLNTSGLDYCYIQPFYYLHNSPIHQKAEQYGLSGEGLRWKHNTMNSSQCMDLLDELIFKINGPVYANEEYAMWELIYFLFKGYTKEFYRDYRVLLNNLRRLALTGEDPNKDKHDRLINEFKTRHNVNAQTTFAGN